MRRSVTLAAGSTMARLPWLTSALLGYFAVQTVAQEDDSNCTCIGVDYTNGGTYTIDSASSDQFSFDTVFEGKRVRSKTAYR